MNTTMNAETRQIARVKFFLFTLHTSEKYYFA